MCRRRPRPPSRSNPPSLTLTAEEAGSLLDSYTLISESDGTLVYELTAAEYTALLQQLEQQGLAIAGAATAEEAEADGTILVHVIPRLKKCRRDAEFFCGVPLPFFESL